MFMKIIVSEARPAFSQRKAASLLRRGFAASSRFDERGQKYRDTMTESTRRLVERFGESDQQRRFALSKAITLVESNLEKHQEQANLLLQHLLQRKGGQDMNFFRLGIAGPPGAGKSTLIEAFGSKLLSEKAISKLAVVCIDPSSTFSGGSILGDKTRMMHLATHPQAYIRPSANGGTFGGLSAYTDDVVSLCRAAQYDFVIVESVGLGQSEIEVAKSVDMMVLVLPPAGGDELQGVKKGIVEVAETIVINKADGDLLPAARRTASDYKAATRYVSHHRHPDWSIPPVILVSSHTQTGLDELWGQIQRYWKTMEGNGNLFRKRQDQSRYWTWKNLNRLLMKRIQCHAEATVEDLYEKLDGGQITPRVASKQLMESMLKSLSNDGKRDK